ncbi:PLP-dependent aspartate aminotransferase family protein [Rhodoplanes sp. TEM]|uniref:PLP-dependent aspartate aminotransferase family protein n=1 Tax=Rhodoplanes tepidamans TaxID=200616 RepID=A0ABT5JBT9_RHOTP|nr:MULTISPECIES: PLP-dependent aspartate aminotransferase family protein [Rhodoplanes]MDC7786846.1 PLP-dependent aspartate aminotransferase family protein [Rhodoplanes tepidamans]MDC7984225.1 PLP-dependent aspartate aminotransferase family protein [Rhodoplanes sp. TEM]MDQ0355974.1 cystathionine gamma-synthase [Rhodoplanes tepidamans]
MIKPPSSPKPRTLAAQALGDIEPQTGGIVPPVHVATTFLRDPDNGYSSGYVYGRPDNATVRQAEGVLAALEGAAAAMLLGSGMSAATAAVMALPEPGHIVASQVMYWAFRDWLLREAPRYGHTVEIVDTTDLAAVRAAVVPGQTRLVWIETPGNPLWTITDIAGVVEIAHAAGARVAVDSTVATPVFSRPLSLGADLVMHSATKYLNGHSDVIAGGLATARPGDPWWTRIAELRARHGLILGPFEAWLLLRGMRTLDVRVRAQSEAAALLATWLGHHRGIERVLYPGLPHHPGHAIATRQMTGYGAMLSVQVHGGEAAAIAVAAAVALWKRATSLGGVESLIEHRASIEGPGSPCPTNLLRLSVGLEDPEDLYADLDRALGGTGA